MQALNAADWAIITVIGLSTLLSLLRGFVREAFSLLGWVAAFLVAMVFTDRFAYLLSNSIHDPTGRQIVAFAILFVATLIVVALVSKLVQSVVEFVGLGSLDRVLGMGFGLARGVFVLLAAIAVLRPAFQLERFDWWRGSQLLPHLLLMEGWFRGITGWLSALLAGVGH